MLKKYTNTGLFPTVFEHYVIIESPSINIKTSLVITEDHKIGSMELNIQARKVLLEYLDTIKTTTDDMKQKAKNAILVVKLISCKEIPAK